ncbi:MAG: antitoxin [Nocardioides sp.]|nr:antitoxin [Nocardioides sp.]
MGLLDKLKFGARKAVDSQGEKIGEGVDKGVDVIDDKTGGKLGDHKGAVADKAKDALDGLDGKNDDIS